MSIQANILIVDDDANICQYMKTLLNQWLPVTTISDPRVLKAQGQTFHSHRGFDDA